MKLIDFPSGRMSLEFDISERDGVLDRLRALGVSRVRYATYDLLTVRNCTLAYVDEWDEPCLISIDPSGDELLREISAAI